MREKKVGVYLLSQLISLIVFVGLIFLIFNTFKKFFYIHIIILILFIIIAFFSSIGTYFSMRWGWTLLSMLYALVLLDLLIIYFWTKEIDLIFFITTVVTAIGFIVAVSNIQSKEEETEEETRPTKEFKPGKYIASKTANFYHIPKCDWAKRIRAENQVWYDSKEEAEKNQLKPHTCLK